MAAFRAGLTLKPIIPALAGGSSEAENNPQGIDKALYDTLNDAKERILGLLIFLRFGSVTQPPLSPLFGASTYSLLTLGAAPVLRFEKEVELFVQDLSRDRFEFQGQLTPFHVSIHSAPPPPQHTRTLLPHSTQTYACTHKHTKR